MARKLKSDKVLFFATLALVGIGIVMVYSASAVMALDVYGQPYFYLFKQVTWAVVGISLLAIVMRIDYRTYKQPRFVMTMLFLVMLALVAVLFMRPINNTSRWFGVGGIGVQPSELAKLACILFVAVVLSRITVLQHAGRALTIIAIPLTAMVGLILLQPDFGTAMSLVILTAVMIFVAGISVRALLLTGCIAAPVIVFLIAIADYRIRRLMSFLDPWKDPLGDGFQLNQSLIAVGTGGVFGRGLMEGLQKLYYLPEPHTDFIYAVVSEEFGLLGATIVLVCFSVLIWRGLRTALRAPDAFGALLATGLTMMIAIQAFINMSVVLGLLPTKGIPLPFVSAGGSSMLVSLLGLGILLNVSQHASPEE